MGRSALVVFLGSAAVLKVADLGHDGRAPLPRGPPWAIHPFTDRVHHSGCLDGVTSAVGRFGPGLEVVLGTGEVQLAVSMARPVVLDQLPSGLRPALDGGRLDLVAPHARHDRRGIGRAPANESGRVFPERQRLVALDEASVQDRGQVPAQLGLWGANSGFWR